MTGFGTASLKNKKFSITIQIKSVNGRFFEPKFRMPRYYQGFESEMRAILNQKIFRGTVDVGVNRALILDGHSEGIEVIPNLALAQGWVKASQKLAKELGVEYRASIESLQKIPDIFQIPEPTQIEKEEMDLVLKTLHLAVDACSAERKREGDALRSILEKLLQDLSDFLTGVTKKKKHLDENLRKGLEKKLKILAHDFELDPQRLNQEAVYLLEKADIEEEIARLSTHIDGFKKHLHTKGSQGKKLDFLVQEMHREVNTMGSKTQALDVVIDVIEAKATVEKIREQVQNIE